MKDVINIKKIFFLFNQVDPKYKINLFFQLILSFILTLLDLFALGAILPTLILIVKKEIFLDFIEKNNFLFLTESFSIQEILYLLISFIFILTIAKVFLSIFINYFKYKYFTNIQHELSKKLLSNYLNLNFAKFNTLSSGKLVNNIKLELERTCSYFTSLLEFLIEIILMITILLIILFINFKISISFILFIFLLSYVFSFFIKSYSSKWGDLRSVMYTRIYQNLFEIFKAFKNIKIYKTQRKFSDLFSQLDRKITGIDIKSKTLFVLPKIYFEGVIIIAVLFLILFFIFFNFSENQVIIILSFYALCSYKIIPGISKIHHHTEQIKFLSKSFYNIFDEYVKKHVSENELNSNFLIKTVDLEEQNLMKLNNICFSYVEDKTSNIFENLNLEIKKNNKLAIIGKSGIGKSTLLDILTGLRSPDTGDILLNKKIFKNKDEYFKKISYVDQFPYLIDENLNNNIIFGEEDYNESKLKRSIELSLVNEFISDANLNLNKSFGEDGKELSGGQKQRISIARALYRDPDILILDEPTSALDKDIEVKIMNNLLKFKENLTIILVTHKEDILNGFDKVYKLENRKLIEIK